MKTIKNAIHQGWRDCLNSAYAWFALLSSHCEQYPEIYTLLFWVQLTPRWRYQQTPTTTPHHVN
jgi:hypothetical protein